MGSQHLEGVSKLITQNSHSDCISIRYAKPPIGDLRFRKPQPLDVVTDPELTQAYDQPPKCIQGGDSKKAKQFGFVVSDYDGEEDCLFLNIYAPKTAVNLPVFVWIRE